MLRIENHKKLLGKELYGSGKSGSTYWKVVSIMEHLHQYVIFLEQPDTGWERKASLSRHHAKNRVGCIYQLQCGTEHIFVDKNNLINVEIFSNHLESFL